MAAPSAPPAEDWFAQRMGRLSQLAARYEIRPDFVARLRQLEQYEIVMVLDDSGSMNTPVANAVAGTNPYARQSTRWDELRHYASIVVDLGAALDPSGVDLYFLNRPPIFNVSAFEQVQHAFTPPPAGFTPLSRVTRGVLTSLAPALAEKRVLLVIATDGQPTDDVGTTRIAEFVNVLKQRNPNVLVSLLACTDDESQGSWINAVDATVPGVDSCDDYASERREVQRSQGQAFAFSFGDCA